MSLPDLKLEIQKSPSIKEFQTFSIQDHTSWMSPILSYLRDGQLPSNSDEARKTKKRATRFTMLNGVLYKRGFLLPYLRCVKKDESKYILEEVHERICGDHMGARLLVGKIIRARYFLAQDAEVGKGVCQKMRQVPEVRKRLAGARRKEEGHNFTLAICLMEDRHCGSFTLGEETGEIHARGDRLLH